MTDSGTENVNGNVDALLDREGSRRVLAQVEVSFSNSMIEAFWRSLRHAWLYLHTLDTTAPHRLLREGDPGANEGEPDGACGVCAGDPDLGASQSQQAKCGMP